MNRTLGLIPACVYCLMQLSVVLRAETGPPAEDWPLTTTQAIQELTHAQADEGRRVRIEGVVTFSQPFWRILFVQDATGGIYCEPGALSSFPEPGHRVVVQGRVGNGSYLPILNLEHLRDLGPAAMPVARAATAAELWNGRHDADLVRLTGHVSTIKISTNPSPLLTLELLSGGLPVEVQIPKVSDPPAELLPCAEVQVEGVFGPTADMERHISKVGLVVAFTNQLTILRDSASVLKQLPVSSFASFWSVARPVSKDLLKLRGTVALTSGSEFYLNDGTNGVGVDFIGAFEPVLGEQLEVAAVPSYRGDEVRFHMVRLLSRSAGKLAPVVPVNVADLFDRKRYGQLVQVDGEFLHHGESGGMELLVMRENGKSYEARMRFPNTSSIRHLRAGSRLRVSGILRILTDGGDNGPSARVLVTSPDNVQVLTPPPWPQSRTLRVVSILSGALGLGFFALGVAHRRLKRSNRRVEETEHKLRELNNELEERICERTTELASSEERFARAFHASPASIMIVRLSDGKFIDVNDQFVHLMKHPRQDVIGRTSLELQLWADTERREEFFRRIKAGERLRDFECVCYDREGKQKTLLASVEQITLRGETCILGICHDITARKQADRLRSEQTAVLEMIAQGAPLNATLERLVLAIEDQAPGILCSVLLIDEEGRHLRHGAAPSLPDNYTKAIDGVEIGPSVGSCGTAAFLRKSVIVESIESDPLWVNFKDLALSCNLRSCWSTPILDAQGELLGTFALYSTKPALPTPEHQQLIIASTHTAAICIKRAFDEKALLRTQQTLRESHELLRKMGELARIGGWSYDVESERVTWSEEIYRIHDLPPGVEPSTEEALQFYPPEARPLMRSALDEAIRLGTPWDLELPLITAKGRRIWVRGQGEAEFHNNKAVRLHGAFQDITDRKEIEEALRVSEERFAKAFQNSPAVGTISTYPDGIYLDVNQEFTELIGYTRQELLGKSAKEIGIWVNPNQREECIRMLETGQPVRGMEWAVRAKSGQRYTVLGSLVRVQIDGSPCLLTTSYDITRRKRTENALRALVSNPSVYPGGSFFTYLAQRMSEIFETRCAIVAERIPGDPHNVMMLGAWLDGKPASNFKKSLVESPCIKVLEDGIAVFHQDVSCLFPHDTTMVGLQIQSYIGISILNSRREPVGLVAILHDAAMYPSPEIEPILRLFAENAGVELERSHSIAALRSAEARFRSAIEHSFDCLVMADATGNCIYVSPGLVRILGYSPEEMIGHSLFPLVESGDKEAVEHHFAQLLRQPGAHAEIEFRARHKDGSIRWIQSSDTNRLQDPNLAAIVSNFRDITEQKLSEAERVRLELQLRQSQKMEAIGTLAGGIAHDFNNILGTIIGNTELAVGSGQTQPPLSEYLHQVLLASWRAKELVRQILTFSRREDFQRTEIRLEELLPETMKLLRASLPATIEVIATSHPPLPLIEGNRTLIQQVIINLVTNSAQAIGVRSGLIEIEVEGMTVHAGDTESHSGLRAGPHAKIVVRDNGPGIPPAILDRIFEPFFTTKGPGEGTGLGLSVVHGIVQAHQGVIQVTSRDGQGTAFEVLLPALDRSVPEKPSPAPTETPSIRPHGSERILLIDDEPSLLKVGERVLRQSGYEVQSCLDPEEALRLFQSAPASFDLVITDFSMPGLTGLDLAAKLREMRPQVPILICTGYGAGLTPDRARDLGFHAVLQKPVEVETLCKSARSALDAAGAKSGFNATPLKP